MNAFNKFLDTWNLRSKSFDEQLLLYVTLLSIWDKSPKTVTTYISGICSEYKLLGIKVQNEFLLQRILHGVCTLNKGPRWVCFPVLIQHLPHVIAQIGYLASPYHRHLYSAMTYMAYHCLLWVGKITDSPHNIRERDVEFLTRHIHRVSNLQMATNVVLVRFALTRTDPHGEKQQVTWCAMERDPQICSIKVLLDYLAVKPPMTEFFFVNPDKRPVSREAFITVLNKAMALATGDTCHYKSHSLRMGGAVYLLLSGWSLDQIMVRRRWVTPWTSM